jgi:mRNA (guanine-N7-)-methyltransferase
MSTTCPNGHLSTTTDYCDQCGVRVADIPVPEMASNEPASNTQTAPNPTDVEVSPDTTPSLLSPARTAGRLALVAISSARDADTTSLLTNQAKVLSHRRRQPPRNHRRLKPGKLSSALIESISSASRPRRSTFPRTTRLASLHSRSPRSASAGTAHPEGYDPRSTCRGRQKTPPSHICTRSSYATTTGPTRSLTPGPATAPRSTTTQPPSSQTPQCHSPMETAYTSVPGPL